VVRAHECRTLTPDADNGSVSHKGLCATAAYRKRIACRFHRLAVVTDDTPPKEIKHGRRVWWHASRRLRQPCRHVFPIRRGRAHISRTLLPSLPSNTSAPLPFRLLRQISRAGNLVPKRWYAEGHDWHDPPARGFDLLENAAIRPAYSTELFQVPSSCQ